MSYWEIIDQDSESYLFMREVDGGWLYKTVDFDRKEPQRFAVAMIFIPDKETSSDDLP